MVTNLVPVCLPGAWRWGRRSRQRRPSGQHHHHLPTRLL